MSFVKIRRSAIDKTDIDYHFPLIEIRLYLIYNEIGKHCEKGSRCMKIIRPVLIVILVCTGFVTFGWLYSSTQLAKAASAGVYDSAEQGMLALAEKHYTPDRQVKILKAGTNSFNGNDPFIWYVMAEVRASARSDGSALGHNGCDAPGSFFLQTRNGKWVHVPEGAFPTFMGMWMKLFGWAGEGQIEPSTDWAPDQSIRFCQ
jgi:hypothetical protein